MERPTWEYATPGPLRDRLSGLTLAGAKTTTFGIDVLTAALGESVEEVGQEWVMVGTNGVALAVIEISEVERLRLADVRWEQVQAEGESFVSVEDWRRAHERFWEQFVPVVRDFLVSPEWTINDDTIVTCTTVRVVERLAGHDSARYPVVECVVGQADLEVAVDALHELGTTGIEEVGGAGPTRTTAGSPVGAGEVFLRAGFASDEHAVAAEASLDRAWRPRYEVVLGDAWLDSWREHFQAQRIGRILVLPDWPGASSPDVAIAEDDVVVRLDPARSFGTGAHPTTRLMLQAMQALPLAGCRVADVGCGSGVLTSAALLLGAAIVHASDIEAAALDATVDNARRNGVGDRCAVAVVGGPTKPDRMSTNHLRAEHQVFDVVLANILAPVLIAESDVISSKVAEGGVLLLAGLIEDQRDRVLAAYPGFEVETAMAEAPWVAIQLRRRPRGPGERTP